MSWRDCAKRDVDVRSVVVAHDGRAFLLWHARPESSVYDPRADRWESLSDPFGADVVREGAVVRSVGSTLLVWGGGESGAFKPKPKAGGARLQKNDGWAAMSAKRAPTQRLGAISAWTGRELLVWGGQKDRRHVSNGGAYDPETDTWRKLAARETAARSEDSLWSGSELWLWNSDASERSGHAYNPETDTWRDLAALPETRQSARATIRCGDGALHVCRELEGCLVWRYEPRADLWEPSAPPPKTGGRRVELLDCDGRLVLAVAHGLFEYLPARDAWAELPHHGIDGEARLLWLNDELYAFGAHGSARALTLPEEVTALAAEEMPVVIGAASKPEPLASGPAVTAVAIVGETTVAAYEDGRVRRGDDVVRQADGTRILDLVDLDGAWMALTARGLEGESTTIALDIEPRAIARSNGRTLIAGKKVLAWLEGASLGRSIAIEGDTTHLAFFGDTITRTVRGKTRDTVELRDVETLAVRQEIVPRYAPASVSAVPLADGVVVGGRGSYRTERYPRGKKRFENFSGFVAYTRLCVSDDARWLAGCSDDGVAIHGLDDEHSALWLPVSNVSALALSADGTQVAYGTTHGHVHVVHRINLGVTMIPALGAAVVTQPPRSEVLGRFSHPRDRFPELAIFDEPLAARPDGERSFNGWQRWRFTASGQEHYVELPDEVDDLTPLPDGGLAMRARGKVLLLSPAYERRHIVGPASIERLRLAPDGTSLLVLDLEGTLRRWKLD